MLRTTTILLAILSTTLFACGEEPHAYQFSVNALNIDFFPSINNLDNGLTLVKADPAEGLLVAYREGDRVVYAQTLRGEDLVLGENTQDPDAPEYAVNLRVVDMNGTSFIMSLDGHDTRVNNWHKTVEEIKGKNNEINQLSDFNMSERLVERLSEKLTEELSGHFLVEIDMLRKHIKTTYENLISVAKNPDGHMSNKKEYRYWVRVTKKNGEFSPNPSAESVPGDHSAIIAITLFPSGSARILITSNHGTPANDEKMTLHCQNIIERVPEYKTIEVLDDLEKYDLGSNTSNNITAMQYKQIITDYEYPAKGRSNTTEKRAPTCLEPSFL